MKSISNILFSIMMGMLMFFVTVWYLLLYIIDIMLDWIETGTHKIKKLRK